MEVSALRVLIDSRIAEQQAKRLNTTLGGVEKSGNRVTGAFDRLTKGLFSFSGIVGGLSMGYVIKEFTRTADAMTNLEARIKLVTGSTQELAYVQQNLFNISQSTSTSIQSTTELYARMGKSLRDIGKSSKESLSLVETINQSIAISGANAQEASSGLVQFAQGLASNRLSGDELRSVLEQLPGLADAIAEGMGKTRGQLRDLGQSGQLTAQSVLDAIEKSAPKIAEKFAIIPDTASKAFQRLRNEVTKTIDVINKETGYSQFAAGVIDGLSGVVAQGGFVIQVMAELEERGKIFGHMKDLVYSWANSFGEVVPIVEAVSGQIALLFVDVGVNGKRVFGELGDFAKFAFKNLPNIVSAAIRTTVIRVTDGVDAIKSQVAIGLARVKPLFITLTAFYASLLDNVRLGLATFSDDIILKIGGLITRLADVAGKIPGIGKGIAESLNSMSASLGSYANNEQEVTKSIIDRDAAVMQAITTADAQIDAIEKTRSAHKGAADELVADTQDTLVLQAQQQDAIYDRITAETKQAVAIVNTTNAQAGQDAGLVNSTTMLSNYRQEVEKLEAKLQEVAKREVIKIGFELGIEDLGDGALDGLTKQFAELNKIPAMFKGIGVSGEAAIGKIVTASKYFATAEEARKDKSKDATQAYIQGVGASFGALQQFTEQGSKEYQALSIASAVAAVAAAAVAPPPFGMANAIAMAAALASLGIQIANFGGGSSSGIDVAKQRQDIQGTGTVLGDSSAKSEGITKALDLMADNLDGVLEINTGMLYELRTLNSNIANLGSSLARQLDFEGGLMPGVSGSNSGSGSGAIDALGDVANVVDTATLGLLSFITAGTIGDLIEDVIGGAIGNISAKRVWKVDEGIELLGGTIAEIMDGGMVEAVAFADLHIKKKKTGHSAKYHDETKTAALGDEVSRQFGEVISGIYSSVESALKELNFADMPELGETFEGLRISTQGLEPAEAIAEVEAVLSKFAGDVAKEAIPAIVELQQNGETTFETLSRLVTQTKIFNNAADSLGLSLIDTGTGVALTGEDIMIVADELANAAGGVGQFASNMSEFLDAMLTDDAKFDILSGAITGIFDEIGEATPSSREAISGFISSLDLTTEAGQRAFTAVTGASDLLNSYYDTLEQRSEAAYSVDTALGIADGKDPLRDALDGIGLSLDGVEAAALNGLDGLVGLIGGLNNAQKAAIEPFIDSILDLIPASAQAADAIDTTGLQIRLMTAQGDAAGALALRREQELSSASELEAGIIQQIYAAEDATSAAKELASVEAGLAAERERVASELYGLETRLLQVQGDTEALRARELALLDPSNQAMQTLIWSLEDQAIVTQDAANAEAELLAERERVAQETYSLESTLLQLQGDTVALRQRELDALDPSNHALQQQIYALEDLKVAEDLAAEKANELKNAESELAAERDRIAQEYYGLETTLLQLLGETNTLRQRELEQLDPSNRAIQERIWSIQDQQAADEEATRIAENSAAEQLRIAQELADKQNAIASERYGLETQWLNLVGDTASLRLRELENIDESNQSLQNKIWAYQDEQTAIAELTRIAEEAASERLRVAQEEANKQKAIASERYGLETQWLTLIGDTVSLRSRELENINESNQGLQKKIWAYEDEQAAIAESAKAANEAAQAEKSLADERDRIAGERYGLETQLLKLLGQTNALRSRELAELDPSNRALQSQIYALQDAAEARTSEAAAINKQISALGELNQAAEKLRDFARDIKLDALSPTNALPALQKEFFAAASLAKRGNLEAAQQLPGLGNSVIDAAKNTASSRFELDRITATLANAANGVAVSIEKSPEIHLLERQLSELETISNAITSPSIPEPIPVSTQRLPKNKPQATQASNDLSQIRLEIREGLRSIAIHAMNTAKNTGKVSDYAEQWDVDGLPAERA